MKPGRLNYRMQAFVVICFFLSSATQKGETSETQIGAEEMNVAVAREIKGSDLVVGEAYFILTYADAARVVPTIDSVVYIGQNLDGETNGSRYFQDAVSFLELGAYPDIRNPSADEAEADLIVTEAEPPANIYTVEGLVKALGGAVERAAGRPRLKRASSRDK